ncbi:MAG TPA: ATP-binding protein [Gemmatimonadaceae bacterium]|nr:ATP-binding protein [Gemmatimonadaceae bacterium]
MTIPGAAARAREHDAGGDEQPTAIGAADGRPSTDAAPRPGRLLGAEERLAFLAAASAELGASLNYRSTLAALARLLLGALGDIVIVDTLDDDGTVDRVEVAVADAALRPAADALQRYARAHGVAPVAAQAIRTREPVFVRDIDPRAQHRLLPDDELRAIWLALAPVQLLCVPMVARDRVVGLIGLGTRDAAAPYSDADVALATDLAQRAALALDNARLFREANAARARAQAAARAAAYLSRVSTTLGATIDYDATLARVVELVVPAFGDYCQLFLVDAGPSDVAADDAESPPSSPPTTGAVVRRAASACVDPARAALLERLQRHGVLPLEGSQPPAVVARTGTSVLVPSVDDAMLRRVAVDDAHLAIMREIGVTSLLVVPLPTTAGRVIGALSCGYLAEHGRRYDESDLQFIGELARRAGLAIENARLYEAARAAQQAAAVANRTKSDFLATMSHELRTPLSAIIGYGELLADGVTGPVTEAQQQQLRRIGASARHLLTLIEDILTFARLDAGREEVRLEPVDVAALARETAALVEPIALTQGLTLDSVIEPALPAVKTDERRLRQILLNLLGNAVRYTERGGVRLEVARERHGVRLTVSDTGIGIAAEHLEHIFQPFWQVEQHLTRRVGGTGLGLSVTRQLARILGGDVHVRSTPGVGSAFTVTIPIDGDGASPPPTSSSPE